MAKGEGHTLRQIVRLLRQFATTDRGCDCEWQDDPSALREGWHHRHQDVLSLAQGAWWLAGEQARHLIK